MGVGFVVAAVAAISKDLDVVKHIHGMRLTLLPPTTEFSLLKKLNSKAPEDRLDAYKALQDAMKYVLSSPLFTSYDHSLHHHRRPRRGPHCHLAGKRGQLRSGRQSTGPATRSPPKMWLWAMFPSPGCTLRGPGRK